MTCLDCCGHRSWADQLQKEVEKLARDLQRREEDIVQEQLKNQHLERQLREALDELRLRRAATGYLPVLDRPEG